jgi:hypothetical protein
VLGVHGKCSVNPRSSPAGEPEGDRTALSDLFVRDYGKILCAVQEFNHSAAFAEPSRPGFGALEEARRRSADA